MKNLFLTTTAIVVLGGIASASADVSISGYTRFTYDDKPGEATFDPDYNIWLKSENTADTGLTYGGAIRLTPGNDGDASSSRHYLHLENDAGKLIFGQHHGPAYTMSVGADWRGTVSAYTKDSSYNVFQGHETPRVIYMSPNVSGFQFGTSVSQGTEDTGTESQTGLNYSMPFMGSTVKIGHNFSSVDGLATAPKMDSNETGIEITKGGFTFSYLTFDRKKSGTISHTRSLFDRISTYRVQADHVGTQYVTVSNAIPVADVPGTIDLDTGTYTYFETVDDKVKGNEIELAYAANDDLAVNLVHFESDTSSFNDNGADKKYSHLTFGVKYDVMPGLTASAAHSKIDDNGEDESAVRMRLNFNF